MAENGLMPNTKMFCELVGEGLLPCVCVCVFPDTLSCLEINSPLPDSCGLRLIKVCMQTQEKGNSSSGKINQLGRGWSINMTPFALLASVFENKTCCPEVVCTVELFQEKSLDNLAKSEERKMSTFIRNIGESFIFIFIKPLRVRKVHPVVLKYR